MALTSSYVQPVNRIPDIFNKIRDGQAPERVTQQLLKDWGFSSTSDRPFIPLLKALGFLSTDGKPTTRYLDYRDHSRSKAVMTEALREAYGDLFLIKERPTESDRAPIEGKFKSFHNASDNVASLMARTFFGLLPLADLTKEKGAPSKLKATIDNSVIQDDPGPREQPRSQTALHYNIQIHLQATKDVEIYNAIFKSLRDHLL